MINYLYKYRSYNNLSLEMLSRNRYYFASAKKFNDPLDCACEPKYELPSIDKIIEYQARVLQDTHGLDYSNALERSQVLRSLNKSKLDEFFENIRISVKNILLNEYGILSLSEKNDHILMWSHYADCHKGFCIEFLRTFDNHLSIMRPVNYFDEYPDFSYFDDLPGNIAKQMIFCKASVWSYEAEWRGIQKANTEVVYSDDMITGIIFGINMPEKHKEKIKNVLRRNKNIKYYQVKLVYRKFQLKISQIT